MSKEDNIFTNCERPFNAAAESFAAKIDIGFIVHFNALATKVTEIAVSKGWWKGHRNEGEMIALMHSELSEALEALREGNPPDTHIPNHSSVAVELADCIIRIMDFSSAKGHKVAEALIAKVEFNKTRPYKHGGKKF